jgi:hypothetical protein
MTAYVVLVELVNLDDDADHLILGPYRSLEVARRVSASLDRTVEVERRRADADDVANCSVRVSVRAVKSTPEARLAIREFTRSFAGSGDEARRW